MDVIELAFLGTPLLRRGEQPVHYARAKGLALLLYLAITRVAQPREHMLDLLWPESLPQAARKNMRNTLWSLRDALGDDVLVLNAANIQLSAAVTVDVHRLEDGLLLLEGGNIHDLLNVVQQYRGPLADGLTVQEAPEFELWLTVERERIAATYVRLLTQVLRVYGNAGEWQQVIDYAQRLIAVDPLHESAHLAIIEAYMRLGQRTQATQQYALLTDILQRELAVAPLPETIARYEALQAGTLQPVPPPQQRPTPLPAPSPPFVGREAELAVLRHAQQKAGQNRAQVVLLSGDLGIGKSRLLRTWAAMLPADAILLETHALEAAQSIPFGPLLTLFRQTGPAHTILQPPSPLAPIWLAELTRLLPELASVWPDLPTPLALSPAEERGRLFQALTEALRPLAQTLLVLVIDDLHWADPSTIDWLGYLVDQFRDQPLLVIGTYRPQETNARIAIAITGWQRQGQLYQIALPPLAADEARTLLAGLGAESDADTQAYWVHQSGGNPYFLIELSRGPVDEPPHDLASLVRARIRSAVAANAYQVLQAAALLGDDADFATLRATSGRTEEETLDALDALVEAAVVIEREGVYRFAHPLVATVVAQDLTQARRTFLHRRAAQALEHTHAAQLDRAAGSLMKHYAAAGALEQAAHYADLATRQALTVNAFIEAITYARQALEWDATPQRQFVLGQTLTIAGDAEGTPHLQAALHGFEQMDDAAGATRAGATLAQTAIATGKPDEARSWLSRLPVERAQAADPALSIQVHLLAASIDRLTRAFEDAEAQLELVDQILRTHQMPQHAAISAFERGNLLANRGELRAANAAFARSLELSRTANDPVHQAMAHNNLAYHLMLVGDLEAAERHLAAAIDLANRFALGLFLQYVYSTAGEIALARGDLAAADAALSRALDAARSWNNTVHIANIYVNQALVARARNDLSRARSLLERAQTIFNGSIDPFVQNKIARYRAELLDQPSTTAEVP